MKYLLPVTLFLGLGIFLLFSACAVEDSESDSADKSQVDDDDDNNDDNGPDSGWNWEVSDLGDLVIRYDDRIMVQGSHIDQVEFDPAVYMLFGFFHFFKSNETATVLHFEQTDKGVILKYIDQPVGTIDFEQTGPGNLRVTVHMAESVVSEAMRLHFRMMDEDRFWGFGEQYNYVDFRGLGLPIWVQEQGVGRRENPVFPFHGSQVNSYFPMPYFMDPGQGKGFLLENSEYSYFDLGNEDPTQWYVEVWNGQEASFLLFPGPEPADVIAQLTGEVGRPEKAPPDWAFSGVILAAQGGTDAVRDRLETALNADIPVFALWVQDWVGVKNFGLDNYGVKYRWNLDEDHYPGFEDFLTELNGQGVRFLGYFNPFVAPKYEQFATGAQNGFLVKHKNNDPFVFIISTFMGSLLDVSNPAAVDWFKGYARAAVDLGMSGWMADFGEWLPYNSAIAEESAPSFHNQYATAWHRINREVLDETYPGGDYVMLTRSGFTGEQKVAQIVWAGDQEADWSSTDGLPTVVTAGLTIGMAGIPYFSHDIAGFSNGVISFSEPVPDKELFLRWTELGAFSPVMRTHDGLKKESNHHFDSDQETLEFFTLFAKIHNALSPYLIDLAADALDTGLPIIRHTVLVDPDWEAAYEAHTQWMIGEDVLFTPVVTQGADSIEVAFPDGQWVHLFTENEYSARTIETVAAPIGTPAVFVRKGRLQQIVQEIRQLFDRQ